MYKRDFFVDRSNILANDLFLSSDSEAEATQTPAAAEDKKMKRKPSKQREGASTAKKQKIKPITPPARLTALELFGGDSGEEDISAPSCSRNGKPSPPIHSYLTRRQAKGYSRQVNDSSQGKYYVELKIYDVEEIKKIQPINRWRYAITTVKTRMNDDKLSWRYLKDFVREAQKDFKNCPVTLLGMYES